MLLKFTKHAEKKLKDFKSVGVFISKNQIEKIVDKPLHIDQINDYPNIIASGEFDKGHVLRVVYKIEADIIVIITCYPARKGRYFS